VIARVRAALFALVRAALAPVAFVALLAAALAERGESVRRRRAGERPRLVYGPAPIISWKYMAAAMRRRGYRTLTFVHGVPEINARADYDASLDDLFGGSQSLPAATARALVGPYVAFARVLRRGDVFHSFFDGGFLRSTPLRFLEVRLLHAAGKRLVVMPYGADVAVPSRLRSPEWRRAFDVDYPQIRRREAETLRWIDHFTRRADFVVACIVHFETLPRWDLLTTHYYPIDTDEWAPAERPPTAPDAPVGVFHSANHRTLKGTEHVVRACEALAAEGLPVLLDLVERVPNSEVRERLRAADVHAEQFVVGYALAAMEGMALGKPVLSNLSAPGYYELFRERTGLDECPILDTPPERLEENLRRLVLDQELRAEVGAAGRRYVLRHHSYEPVGRMWELVYRTVWHGEPLPVSAWHPDHPDGPARREQRPAEAATR
jgi:glycosyltransferase involved in cell wall biosynthesis